MKEGWSTNLGELSVSLIIIGWVCLKWASPFISWDSKISCISQMI